MNGFFSDSLWNFIRQSDQYKEAFLTRFEQAVRRGDSPRSAFDWILRDMRVSKRDFTDSDWKEIEEALEDSFRTFNV